MSITCKVCAAHAKAYRLFDQSERLGGNALDVTLEPYMEHLRDLESACYREVMEGLIRSKHGKSSGQAEVFLKTYGEALRDTLINRGCDLKLAGSEMRAWMPKGQADYSGIRIGINLITQEGLLDSVAAKADALSA